MKRTCSLLLAGAVSLWMAFSAFADAPTAGTAEPVTILYTNDVHSYIDQDLTYSLLAGYRETLPNALLVDAGDQIQGTAYGSMDDGHTVVELMNAAGYDAATLGNHEFDYGMDGCLDVVAEADFPYLSCNFYHEENGIAGDNVLDSYQVFTVNGKKIAFVGITTPESFTKSTPAYFQDEDGNYLYGIAGGADGTELYTAVQTAIDAASREADVVIGLGHLGDDVSSRPWTSSEVIAHTRGLDAFIDGHSHSTVPCREVLDRDGHPVVLTQTGCYFAAVGQMTLEPDGGISTRLLTAQDLAGVTPDAKVKALEDAWISTVTDRLGAKIGSSALDFTINFPDSGTRAIRMAETNLGDFNADTYYWYSNEVAGLDTDLALINGGGIRANAPAGDWTYLTCKTINTFGNVLCVVRASGQDILDALEFGARKTGLTDEATGARAENGGFLQVSGLTYEIDTSVPDTVPVDDKGVWQGSPSTYRVTHVAVYDKETGRYEPLDPDATYTVAGTNYTLLNGGDGFAMFDDAQKVLDGTSEDYLALAAYVSAFSDTDGDGYADIASANSPLAAYEGYTLRYEDPAGAGRITIRDATSVWDSSDDISYIVAAGDSLWRIAESHYGSGRSWRTIFEANRDVLVRPDWLEVGQTLVLPAGA